jgi:LEA14-like dessication related protein
VRTTASLLLLCSFALGACSALPNRDPLNIDVAGIEPLQGEGLELRLSVKVRIQNPNDSDIEYSGAALNLDLNGRKLASGVSSAMGTVPRYGEAVLEIPVTISALSMVRQVLGFVNNNAQDQREVKYTVHGKLEGGVFGTRRFTDDGTFELPADRVPANAVPAESL